jgi:hypothetical protein
MRAFFIFANQPLENEPCGKSKLAYQGNRGPEGIANYLLHYRGSKKLYNRMQHIIAPY